MATRNKTTGKLSGAISDRVQAKNPVTGRWVKIDTTTGPHNKPQEIGNALQECQEKVVIFCPLTSDECSKKIIPLPRTAFIISPSAAKRPSVLVTVIQEVLSRLKGVDFRAIDGASIVDYGDLSVLSARTSNLVIRDCIRRERCTIPDPVQYLLGNWTYARVR
jgi:hypothetical protein